MALVVMEVKDSGQQCVRPAHPAMRSSMVPLHGRVASFSLISRVHDLKELCGHKIGTF